MHFWRRWGGLRNKIIAWSFVPTAIILTIVALVGFYAYQQVAQDLTIQGSREVARLAAAELAGGLSEYSSVLTTLARTASIYENNPASQRAALAQAGNRLAVFDGGVLILDNYGTVVAAQPARPEILGQDWSSRDYFRQIIRVPATVYSNGLNDGPGGSSVIVVAVPITSGRGELVGTLAGMFRVGAASVSSFYGTIVRLRIDVNGSAYLVDHNGIVFYHTSNEWIGQNLGAQPVVQLVNSGKADALRTRDADGRDIVASFAPVPGTPWGLVTEQGWDALLAPAQGYVRFLFLLLILGLVVPAVVVTLGVERITQPIKQLIVATQQVAGGNFGQQMQVHTGDELEDLVTHFNRMSVELAESYRNLKEREERLALVIEGTNDGVWDWNLETDAVYFSPRWKAILGYADNEVANRFDEWKSRVHPDDLERVTEQLHAYLEGRIPVYELEHRLAHKDGSYRWVLARGIALRHLDGKAYRMAGSDTDITERKHAEEAIRQSEKRFSQVFHASPIAISITGLADGRYVEVNDAWLRLFGYTREQVIGGSSLGLNVWVDPRQRTAMIRQLEATGSLRDFEHLAFTKAGRVIDVLVSAEVIELNEERYNLSLVYDITELKQTQQALEQRVAERTHALATLNSVSAVVSGTLDLNEILNTALKKAMELMRMEVGTAYSLPVTDGPVDEQYLVLAARQGLSDKFVERVGKRRWVGTAMQIAAQTRDPLVWLVKNYPDPQVKQALELEGVEQVVNVALLAKGKVVGAFNLGTRKAREVTSDERRLLAAVGQQVAVAVENARLYEQAEKSAALAERSRLARELHDSVTQSLYSVTMYAEAAALALTAGKQPTAVSHLQELRDTAQEALREMRLLIFELRPLALEQQGLAAALRARLDAVEGRGGMKTELLVDGEETLSLAVQQELYHIAQEALNNVIKHARAQRVRVQLSFSERSTCVEISDDGLGFDAANPPGGGLGLAGMKERAERIGGKLDIASEPGRGTTVRLVLRGTQGN